MKRLYKGACVIIAFLFIVPIFSMAKEGVPQIAMDARASVFRVLCEDSEYTYSGSSFVVAADEAGTYLATNYHVVEDARPNSIVAILHDGLKVPAQIVEYSKEYDLCILKTDNQIEGAQPLTLANADGISAGAAVYALGFPGAADYLTDDYAYSVDEITVTDGIISAIKHITTDGVEVTLLQMNAAINAGSSGGPLVNEAGQVVGVNALGVKDASDIYAAIHIKHLTGLLDKASISFNKPATEVSNSPAASTEKALIPVWIWLVVGVVLLVGLTFLCIRLFRRRLTLATLMDRRMQGYSLDEILMKLRPVFSALLPLHARGEAHGNVNPWNIFVDKNGNFILGGRSKRRNMSERIKPYVPMEEYSSGYATGTYSDVYALGAVMLLMLANEPPEDVFIRLQGDTVPDQLCKVSTLTVEEKGQISNALALKKEERLNDVNSLMNALQVDVHSNVGNQAFKPVKQKRIRKLIRWRTVIIGAGVSAIVTAAIVFGLSVMHYNRAVVCLGKKDYSSARQEIAGSFDFYQDSIKLSYYINSAYFLELGYYDEAKTRFQSLGSYRDSQQMALECDYQKAKKFLNDGDMNRAKAIFGTLRDYLDSKTMVFECDYREAKQLLGSGKYDEAKALFTQLADFKYKDSNTMILETDYQNAVAIYNDFSSAADDNKQKIEIGKAVMLLESIKDYSDASDVLMKVNNEIYDYALSTISKCLEFMELPDKPITDYMNLLVPYRKNLGVAEKYFGLVSGYLDADNYMRVIGSLRNSANYDDYNMLMQLWSFNPARRAILGNWYIHYFLEGTWKGDGHIFSFYTVRIGISMYDGIIEDNYKIEGLIIYFGSDEKGWREMFKLNVVNQNTINIYAYKNGGTYTLYRQ